MALAIPLFTTPPVWAQAAPLTLSEAARLARTRSLGVQAGQERVSSSQSQQGALTSALYPTLNVQSTPAYTQLTPGARPPVPPSGGLAAPTTSGPYVDTSVSLNQLLFDGGAAGDQVAIAADQVKINQSALFQAQQDAMASAGTSFFQVQLTEGLAGVAQEAYRQAQDHLRLGQLRLKAGTGTRAEVLQLEAQVANAQVALIQAQNGVTQARLNLGNVLNAPVGDRPLASASVAPLNVMLERDVAQSLHRRPEIQQQELRVETDRRREAVANAGNLPSLTAVGRYTERNVDYGSLFAGVTLNWAAFDEGRNRSLAESAHHDSLADQAVLAQLQLTADLEIRQQVQARDEAQGRMKAAHDGLVAAQEAYRIALHRFQLGLATPFELTDVQTTLTQARNNAVQATSDFAIAEIRLARALGIDLAGYLGAS
jgi:outer membrane protein